MILEARITPGVCGLAALLGCLIGCVILGGITVWTIEHYMDLTPADWPYPGSFWDVANDFTCGFILLPAGGTGRFCLWLVFFPMPILIEWFRKDRRRAALYLCCLALPFSFGDIMLAGPFTSGSLGSIIILLILLIAPPYLIRSWIALSSNRYERRLLACNLIVLWLAFSVADLMLGLSMHANYCKISLIAPLTK